MGGEENVKHIEDCSVSKWVPLLLSPSFASVLGIILFPLFSILNSSTYWNQEHWELTILATLCAFINYRVNHPGPSDHLKIHNALGTWVFSVAGALLAIPVGIKRKSLAPLVFFGTTGTMLDIIMGISACEREHAERQMKLLEAQNAAAETSLGETQIDS
ncbi:hypothetical protein VNO78_30935 [Psophocarpus tetragonolobus]|uniref:Transmembrane protein n=1 Tax=Psophocarpus tetragonolobus TaxID=3891 RepID=A0AAN9RXS3_PSOTE